VARHVVVEFMGRVRWAVGSVVGCVCWAFGLGWVVVEGGWVGGVVLGFVEEAVGWWLCVARVDDGRWRM
jgi:hypothetical protein